MKHIYLRFMFAFLMLLSLANFASGAEANIVIEGPDPISRICIGDTAMIKVLVTDTVGDITDFHYQWYRSGALILNSDPGWIEVAGATEFQLRTTQEGYYYCLITFGPSYSSFRRSSVTHMIVDNGVPTCGITANTVPSSICEGDELFLNANGSSTAVTFGWQINGVPVYSYNSSVYHANAVTLANDGEYTFVMANMCGDTVFGPFYMDVIELPRIVSQPRSAGICAGMDLHFGIRCSGEQLQYQWYHEGLPYTATNGTHNSDTLVIAQVEHDPDFYDELFYVQVSNQCATVTSIGAGTIVSEMPRVVGNPLPETACYGTEIIITADATTDYPTDSLTYQWYFEGEEISGEVSSILSFAVDSAHMGDYFCRFTNGCGSVNSQTAYIAVKMPPIVENQPEATSVCEGDQFSLVPKIVGVEPITYTWYNDNGENFAYSMVTSNNISGVHSGVLTGNPASEQHEHFYYCEAINECGSAITDSVYVTVNQHIQVYPSLPAAVSVCSSADTTLVLSNRVLEGTNYLDPAEFEEVGVTFAWHRVGSTLILAETPDFVLTDIDEDDEGYYVCDITNSCGSITTSQVFLSVIASPEIISQTQELDVCTGGELTLQVSALGDNIRYAWYRDGEMIGTNSPTYTAPVVVAEFAGTYSCVVSSQLGCPATYSDPIAVTVSTTPVVTWQPTPAYVELCEGEAYDLTMTATGDGVNYQWYCNGTPINGQTSPDLHLAAVTRNHDGEIYCIVSNACAEIQTEHAHLVVNNAPDMTLGPDLNPCRGETVVLAPQSGEFGHYSWNFGTYGYQSSLTVSLGGTYILEVSDELHGNCVARDTVVVAFHDYFDIAFDSTPIVTCGEFVLDAGFGAAGYLWSTTDMTNSINVGQSGYYMVTVDGDGYGCTTSAAVNVTIGDEISINLGDDILASVETYVEIGVPAVFENYRWNTGYMGPMLTVDGSEYGIGTHTFWLEVTSGACWAIDTINVTFIEDNNFVEPNEMPQFSVYPNPASDFVNVVSANGAISRIDVYDITGRVLQTERPNAEAVELNVKALAPATYFVKLVNVDGNVSVSKLVIQ
ncbi:MAG: immunoglobulin domain-containing protein [Bacteroidales bacterium]|nr:immunoglobulin domain-containing protein [Bacteroidales bacterium]